MGVKQYYCEEMREDLVFFSNLPQSNSQGGYNAIFWESFLRTNCQHLGKSYFKGSLVAL